MYMHTKMIESYKSKDRAFFMRFCIKWSIPIQDDKGDRKMFNFEMVDDKDFSELSDKEIIEIQRKEIEDLKEQLQYLTDLHHDAYYYFGG